MKNGFYKCCLFDLDGTLLDTSAGLLRSLDYAVEKQGLPAFPEDKRLSIIGPPVRVSLKNQYHLTEKEADAAVSAFRSYYEGEALFLAEVYPGIPAVLKDLKAAGYQIALATYKRIDYAERLLNHFALAEYFDYIGGADFAGILTKADIINLCTEKLNVKKQAALMLGDSRFDAEGAAEAGVDFLALTYGFGFKKKEDLAGYRHIGCCASPEEIKNFLL